MGPSAMSAANHVNVIGANGFLGRHVEAVLGAQAVSVTQDAASIKTLTDGDVVYCAGNARTDLAEQDPDRDYRGVVAGVRAVLQAMRKMVPGRSLVFASSVLAADASTVYGRNRIYAEELVCGRGHTAVRFGSLYGPGSKKGPVHDIYRAVQSRAPVQLYTHPSSVAGFLYVREAAQVLVQALSCSNLWKPGTVLHARGKKHTLFEVLAAVTAVQDRRTVQLAWPAGPPTDRWYPVPKHGTKYPHHQLNAETSLVEGLRLLDVFAR